MTKELTSLFSDTLNMLKENHIIVSNNTNVENGTSIESPQWNKSLKAKQYALDMTKKELDQAVEGLYHNLNTLNLGSLTK